MFKLKRSTYTIAESREYLNQIKEVNDLRDRAVSSKEHNQFEVSLEIMREVYTRMQESFPRHHKREGQSPQTNNKIAHEATK